MLFRRVGNKHHNERQRCVCGEDSSVALLHFPGRGAGLAPVMCALPWCLERIMCFRHPSKAHFILSGNTPHACCIMGLAISQEGRGTSFPRNDQNTSGAEDHPDNITISWRGCWGRFRELKQFPCYHQMLELLNRDLNLVGHLPDPSCLVGFRKHSVYQKG